MLIRKKIILAVASGVFIMALVFAFIGPGQSDKVRAGSGTVVSFVDNGVQAWGIDMHFSLRSPFAPRHVRVSELPDQYQHIGTRIAFTYVIDDIIGIGKWDTAARLFSIQLNQ